MLKAEHPVFVFDAFLCVYCVSDDGNRDGRADHVGRICGHVSRNHVDVFCRHRRCKVVFVHARFMMSICRNPYGTHLV